jgi:hypothetical protein
VLNNERMLVCRSSSLVSTAQGKEMEGKMKVLVWARDPSQTPSLLLPSCSGQDTGVHVAWGH